MAYANNTTVAVSKSQDQIRTMLIGFGVEAFGTMEEPGKGAAIGFKLDGLAYRINLPLPDVKAFRLTEVQQYERSDADAIRHWEKACRSKWRALHLVIKAKIEAVNAEISNFEVEFLPFIICADGQTMWQQALPKIEEYRLSGGKSRLMLPETL